MTKTDIPSCDDERNNSILKKMRSPQKLLTKGNVFIILYNFFNF